MAILITGASGFVGRHVTRALLGQVKNITALCRNSAPLIAMQPPAEVAIEVHDIMAGNADKIFSERRFDALVHLAWSGLPNLTSNFHLTDNLPADLRFLISAIKSGIPEIIVAGTCLEYGMQCGPLHVDMATAPTTPYGLAKDTLRKTLQMLQGEYGFNLKWMRLFYMFGEGQNPRSLLAQLDQAIDRGDDVFRMSKGDQLRDYLPVTEIAEIFSKILGRMDIDGILNCCSGTPTSIIDLVRNRCSERGSNIKLDRGYYPYPSHEPFAFWGVPNHARA